MVGVGIRAGLLQTAVTDSVGFPLVEPEVIPLRLTVCKPAFWATTRSLRRSMVGGFSTGLTVTMKERMTVLLTAAPSSTITVIMVEPKEPGKDEKVRVPFVSGLV